MILGTLGLFSLNDVFAVVPPSFVLKWGSFGTGDSQFSSLQGIATDSSGNVYVAEEFNNRIQKFDSSGTFLRMWGYGVEDGTNVFQICTSSCQEGSFGTGDGQFDGSFGVAVDSADNVYVTDQNNGRAQKFDSSGTFLLKWGSFGTGDGELTSPQGIAVDSTGNVYVADLGSSSIKKFDSSGTFLRMWGYGVEDGTNVFQICTSSCQEGIVGTGDGQFNQPRDVAVDSTGNVYVTDTDNRRIQKFDSSGTFLLKWGSFGTGDGEFTFAIGLATDSSGNVYVADTTNHRIQKFDSSGTFLLKWGSFGTGDGQFNNPPYVTVDSSGNVYVADGNDRVQKFGVVLSITCGVDTELDGTECVVSQALRDEIAVLEDDLDTAQTNLVNCQNSNSQLTITLTQCQDDNSELQATIDGLNQQIVNKDATIDSLNSQIASLNSQISILQTENALLLQMKTMLEGQVEDLESQVAELETILESGEITICHNGKTKIISVASWGTHLNHGDTMGACL